MQREAEARVREMQSRARLIGGEASLQSLGPVPQRNLNRAVPNFSNEKSGALPFNMDSDKLIIMALIWILYNEKADSKLLLALAYLLL